MAQEWTTIESDPGVFSEMLWSLGCKGVQVEELYSLDHDSLQALKPIFGLIFLFKWQEETDDRSVDADYESKGVFFASQVIHNACATQAIVSVLMNRPELDIGPELTQLRDFTAGFPPDMKGLAIGNSEAIRIVHNSFTPPQPIIQEKDDDEKGEAFHFIAYVPVGGALYELDGLKPGPIKLADCTEEDWLEKASGVVTERIGRYAAHEIKFNLMAVVKNRKEQLQEQLHQQRRLQSRIQAKLDKTAPQEMETGEGGLLPDDADTLAARQREAEEEIDRLNLEVALEEEKHGRWREENLRRKTDFIPLAFNLLKVLAEKGQLQPLVDRAVAAQRDKKQ